MWQEVILLAVYGGLISRIHGGGLVHNIPKTIKNLLWALPLAAASSYLVYRDRGALWIYDYGYEVGITFMVLTFAAIAGLCTIGKATGHGGGIDLATSSLEPGKGREPEKLEYLILWLHDRIPRYWYDALLLLIVGVAAVSGAALAAASVNVWAGAVVVAGGASKSVAYMLGWRYAVKMTVDLSEPTEFGELLTGAFAYGAMGIAMGLCGAFL